MPHPRVLLIGFLVFFVTPSQLQAAPQQEQNKPPHTAARSASGTFDLVLIGPTGPERVARSRPAGRTGETTLVEGARLALAAIIAGPTETEGEGGLRTALPARAAIDAITADGRRLEVRLTLPDAFLEHLDTEITDAIAHQLMGTLGAIGVRGFVPMQVVANVKNTATRAMMSMGAGGSPFTSVR